MSTQERFESDWDEHDKGFKNYRDAFRCGYFAASNKIDLLGNIEIDIKNPFKKGSASAKGFLIGVEAMKYIIDHALKPAAPKGGE